LSSAAGGGAPWAAQAWLLAGIGLLLRPRLPEAEECCARRRRRVGYHWLPRRRARPTAGAADSARR
jgi:hypothetical protein